MDYCDLRELANPAAKNTARKDQLLEGWYTLGVADVAGARRSVQPSPWKGILCHADILLPWPGATAFHFTAMNSALSFAR